MPSRPVSHRLFFRARTALLAVLIATCSTTAVLRCAAQAPPTGSAPPPELSRFDLYAGYGYINPGNSAINGTIYQPINPGAVVSAAGYFNRYLGVQAEGSFFPNGPNDCINTAQAGPIFRYQRGRLVPFVHVLGGGAKVGGPVFQPCTWGWGLTGGGGLDYILPFFHNRLAVRPIQADFYYSHVDYGPVDPAKVTGGIGDIYAYRLSAGLVFRLGQVNPPPPVQLGCTADSANPFAGDPLTITAAPANLKPGKKTVYTWTVSGGHITGTNETAAVNTSGLAPGDYTVAGHVSQGVRPGEQASCTVGFRIHAFEPPTMSCSANPATILPGESSTITSSAHSPQNRNLSYSYSASAGQISGVTSTVTLSTAGVSPGPIVVTCNSVDDLGQQASANTTVTISIPPPPAAPPAVPLCNASFERDTKRPVRVDNEAKACLDEIALNLGRDPNAKLVLVGRHSADETPDAAAQRILNVEQYFVLEKGIDPIRIQLRTRGEPGRIVENILLPAGASFAPGDTETLDSSGVKRHGQAYSVPR
jgi:hypothetical protein